MFNYSKCIFLPLTNYFFTLDLFSQTVRNIEAIYTHITKNKRVALLFDGNFDERRQFAMHRE